MDLYTAHKCVTIVAYTVLTFVSHHLLRPEPSVAALAEGDAALNGLGLACLREAGSAQPQPKTHRPKGARG